MSNYNYWRGHQIPQRIADFYNESGSHYDAYLLSASNGGFSYFIDGVFSHPKIDVWHFNKNGILKDGQHSQLPKEDARELWNKAVSELGHTRREVCQ